MPANSDGTNILRHCKAQSNLMEVHMRLLRRSPPQMTHFEAGRKQVSSL
jgi:hypothetical protein